MAMSEAVEWVIHCTVLLAALPPDTALSGKVLAEYHGVSESYLLKNLKFLAAAGLLESIPGPKGGYCLGRPASEITLLDIVNAVEGPQPRFQCADIRKRVPFPCSAENFRVPCAIHSAMLEAELIYREALQKQTVAVLAQRFMGQIDAEALAAGTHWLQGKLRPR